MHDFFIPHFVYVFGFLYDRFTKKRRKYRNLPENEQETLRDDITEFQAKLVISG